MAWQSRKGLSVELGLTNLCQMLCIVQLTVRVCFYLIQYFSFLFFCVGNWCCLSTSQTKQRLLAIFVNNTSLRILCNSNSHCNLFKLQIINYKPTAQRQKSLSNSIKLTSSACQDLKNIIGGVAWLQCCYCATMICIQGAPTLCKEDIKSRSFISINKTPW